MEDGGPVFDSEARVPLRKRDCVIGRVLSSYAAQAKLPGLKDHPESVSH